MPCSVNTALLSLALTAAPLVARATDVTTYHYDNLRTGWDQTETALTPATVASGQFGLLHQLTLDEQVDAQPLFVSAQTIAGAAHDVIYVATENNTVYAIDAATGAVLLQRNLGAAVPIAQLPGGCSNNSSYVGITSTPVIDKAAHALYVIADTYEGGTEVYRVHALDLATLTDIGPPTIISATAPLSDGSTYTFNAPSTRQRPALLETSGNIYAGFGSFCDVNANVSRGWVLGWNAATLAPLPAGKLINQVAHSPSNFYLSAIWMSGYGIASDDAGSLFFVTGNAAGEDYSTQDNLSESVVRLSSDLTTVQGYFTPANHVNLDNGDTDLGAGGVLLLPTLSGAYPHLALAAGKSNPLYLLNRDNLGGLAAHPPALRTYTNNGCWCGQSYYAAADGIGRVVTSTGHNVVVWKLATNPYPALNRESGGPTLASGQDPGFFTTISSNGTAANSAIIWALPHPNDSDPLHTITLTAFNPAKQSQQVFSAAAGTWPRGNANANLVPVIANGHVIVASYKQLAIFGLAAPAAHVAFVPVAPPAALAYAGTTHDLYGTVVSVSHDALRLRTRAGLLVDVDVSAARRTSDVAELTPGHAALIRGDYTAAGIFDARFVMHAKDAPQLWGPDR